jgi:electron transport complex protein RnfD
MSIVLRTSPHIVSDRSVNRIMLHVVLALLPVCAFSVWQYGLSALALIVVVTATCLLTERVLNPTPGQPSSLSDWSATITGVLLALTLPPAFPLWMGVVAGFFAIAIGKLLWGGLGYNAFNPALAGRAFVQAAFPVAISTWVPAFSANRFSEFIPSSLTVPLMIPPSVTDWIKSQHIDAFTGATPLARWKFENVTASTHDFLTGMVTASAGETSAILIVLGSAALLAWAFHLYDPSRYPSPSFVLLSGGLMLGAVFMATDMATSPVTPVGVWIYGAVIGVVTVIIRYFGGLTEGVMYAILLGNALTPLIDQYTQPRVFGTRQKRT